MEIKKTISNSIPELQQRIESYYGSLNINGYEDVQKIPSLKYCVYNYKISEIFLNKIEQIKKDIKELKNRLKDYSGVLLDIGNEKKKLDNIENDLNSLSKKELDEELFFRDYLVSVAKHSDVMNSENAKKVYVGSSEEIIESRIRYFLKCEKKFILYNDIINQLNNFF